MEGVASWLEVCIESLAVASCLYPCVMVALELILVVEWLFLAEVEG